MAGRIDPDLERILPLLPLKNAADLTPSRARNDLVALAASRKDVPLPQPAAVADLSIPTPAGSVPARMYRSLVGLSSFTRRSDYLLTDREAIGAISQ